MDRIGNNIKYLRKQSKISQSELADKLEKNQSTVSYWESGKREIVIEDLFQLCSFFNVSIDDFVNKDLSNATLETKLNQNETRLLQSFSKLSYEQQLAIITMIESMV